MVVEASSTLGTEFKQELEGGKSGVWLFSASGLRTLMKGGLFFFFNPLPLILEVGGIGVKSTKVLNQTSRTQVIHHTIGAETKFFISRREVPSAEPLRTNTRGGQTWQE